MLRKAETRANPTFQADILRARATLRKMTPNPKTLLVETQAQEQLRIQKQRLRHVIFVPKIPFVQHLQLGKKNLRCTNMRMVEAGVM